MTRSEAEEIFMAILMSDDSGVVEMTQAEVQVFRVLVGRMLKEMESKNRQLWLKAREYGIEYQIPYCIIKKRDESKYKIFTLTKEGQIIELLKKQSMSKIDVAEKKGVEDEKPSK